MRLSMLRMCPCGCGRVVKGKRKYASKSCVKVGRTTTSRSKVKCKCGCGHYLSMRQARTGIKFINYSHANMYNAKKLKGKKYNMIKDRDKGLSNIIKDQDKGLSNMIYGKQYCKNYDGTELNCIMCMEQALFKVKSCYKEGK